jgi:hypothetical protein
MAAEKGEIRLKSILLKLVTVLAAFGLLALGWDTGRRESQKELTLLHNKVRLLEQKNRRLYSENKSLSSRLFRCQLGQKARQHEERRPEPKAVVRNLVLSKGRSVLIAEQRAAVVLEDVFKSPERARLRYGVLGQPQVVKELNVGASLSFQVGEKKVHLVVKAIHASSARISVVIPPRPEKS